jgi:excisionase family DNA binding protein
LHPAQFRKRLCTKEAAAYVGLSKSTLDKLRVYGGGPSFSKLGRRVVYDAADLDKWLESNRRRTTSDLIAA